MAESNTQQNEMLDDLESRTPESLHPILEAAFKYRKQLVIGVAVIIGITAIYAGVTGYTAKTTAEAQAKLGAILVEEPSADQIAKLEGLLASVPDAVKPAVNLELAQACMTQGQYDKAATYWNALTGQADDDMKFVARMGKAKALLLAGKAEDAYAELADLAGTATDGYTVPVNRQLALAAEAAGKKAEALAAYKVLAEKNVNDKPFVDYKISQLEAQ